MAAGGGASDCPGVVGAGVAPREEVKAEGVPGRLGVDAEGGGSGERVRRPMEEGMGVGDCADGEWLRCKCTATDGTGEDVGALCGVRAELSVRGVGGAVMGVLRPERVGKSGAGPGGGGCTNSGNSSAINGAVLCVGRGGTLGTLDA